MKHSTRTFRILAGSIAVLLAVQSADAANITWTGGSGTNFETPGNWTGTNTPPTNDLTTDIALFSGVVTANQPSLSISRSITGLSFTTATGGWTLGSASTSNVLTLGASGISSTNTSGTNTISANLAFGASQTLLAGTGGILSLTGGLSMSLASATVTVGSPSNGGAVVVNPGTGNIVGIAGTAASAFSLQVASSGTLVLGGDGSTYGAKTTSTNSIVNSAAGGSFNVATGGTLLVNSGVWNVGELGRNTGTSMTGTVNVSGGTLSIGGMRFTGTNAAINVNGGALIFNNNNSTPGGGRFTFGTNTTTGTATLNLSSGYLDLSKASNANGIGSTTAANTETVLFNQTGGVFRNGISTGPGGGTQTGFNIGNVALGTGSNAVTLTGGTMQIFGTLAATTVGSGGINNFNFMGGTLTAGAINATNFGSSATATGSSNQVATSTNIGTLVNYGGTLAPGGLVYTSSTNSTGDVTLTSVATSGRTAITGGYTQTAAGTLAINLGSTTAATTFQTGAANYDNVTLTGALTLGGTLNVSLINGFGSTITSGNSFNIITGATSITGSFANVDAAGRVNLLTGGSIGISNTASTVTLFGFSNGASLIWAGGVSSNAWDVNTTANFTKGGVASVFNDGDVATFNNSGIANNTVNLNTTVSPGLVTFAHTSGTYTVVGGGGIGGTGALNVQGGGTVVLDTVNGYSGTTTISSGTLQLGDGTTGHDGTIANSLSIVNTGSLVYNRFATSGLDYGGVISGAGSVTKTGVGTQILSGTNTFSGQLSVQQGTLSIGFINNDSANGVLGNSANSVSLGNTGGVTGTIAYTGTTASSTKKFTLVSGGTGAFNVTTSGTTLTLSGVIDGSGSLLINGTGALVLSGANTFTGGVTLNSGTLNINSAGVAATSGPLGNGGTFLINGGTIDNTSGSAKTLLNVTPTTVNADFAFTGGTGTTHDLNLGTGATTLGTAAGTTRTITANAGILTLGGVVANGTTANKIVKAGGGTLALTGVNFFTGGVDVNNGALLVGGTATNSGSTITGSATGTGNVSFASGTSLNSASGATWDVPTITLAGAGSTLNLIGGNRLNVNYTTLELGDTSRTGVTTVNVNSKSLAVTGGNTLASESTGIWSWETNSALGTPTIQNGTLDLETTAFSGTTYGTFFIRSTNFSNADLVVGNNVILLGNGSAAFGTSTSTSPNVTINSGGLITMNGTSKTVLSLSGGGAIYNSMTTVNSAASTLNIIGTSGTTTFSGVIGDGPGTGKLSVTKTGGSTQILSGANTYGGTTTISAGTLSINSIQDVSSATPNSLGQPTTTANGTIGLAATGTLQYTGTGNSSNRVINLSTGAGGTFTLDASGASGTFALTGGVTTSGTSNTSTLTLTGSGLGSESGSIVNGTSTNVTAVTKSGSGTWTFTGNNTYTGTTTLNQGTLTVGTGGTLGATTAPLSVNNTNTTAAGTATILNLATAADTTVGSLNGSISTPTSGTNTATINTQNGRTLTVNQTTNGTYAGVIAGAGGSFTLGSLSTNTLTLTGINTYSGTTTVTSGSLQVGSSGTGTTGTGAVTVQSGSTILGTGIIQGSSFTAASGSTLYAGDSTADNSFGTLNFTPASSGGTVSLQGVIVLGIGTANNLGSIDSTFGGNAVGTAGYIAYVNDVSRSLGLGAGSHDLLSFNNPSGGGSTTLNFLTTTGSLQVLGSGFTAEKGQIFNILDWSNLVTTNFTGFNLGSNYRDGSGDNGSSFDLPTLSGGLVWDVSQFTTSGIIIVVPEPSRALLLMLGLVGLVTRRRRKC